MINITISKKQLHLYKMYNYNEKNNEEKVYLF